MTNVDFAAFYSSDERGVWRENLGAAGFSAIVVIAHLGLAMLPFNYPMNKPLHSLHYGTLRL